MLRIQRALLIELVVTLLLGLIIVTSVMFTGLCLQMMGRTQGLELRYLLALLPPLLPVAIAFGAPYAFLLAVSLVYGRVVADRELIALRISGVHPRVAAAPVMAVGAVLSLVAFVANGWVLPDAAQAVRIQSRNLVDQFLGQLGGSERTIALRRCRLSFGAYEAAERPGGVGVFRDFELDLRTKDGNLTQKMMGAEARLRRRDDELVLESPRAYVIVEDPDGKVGTQLRRVKVDMGHVEALGVSAQFNDIVGSDRFEAKAKDVDLPDVAYLVQRGDTPKVPLRRSVVEWHARLAGAFAPFVFGLTAVAVCFQLTARTRRLTGFLLAFLPVLLIHFPLLVAGKSLADGGRVAPWIGMWGADIVLLVGGLFLLRRAYAR